MGNLSTCFEDSSNDIHLQNQVQQLRTELSELLLESKRLEAQVIASNHVYTHMCHRIQALDTYHLHIMDSDLHLPWLDNEVQSQYIQDILMDVKANLMSGRSPCSRG